MDLGQLLRRVAQGLADEHGFEYEPEAEAFLDRTVEDVVERLADEGGLANEAALVRVQEAWSKLILNAGPDRFQEYGPRIITEGDLREVLAGLCPGFWPFC